MREYSVIYKGDQSLQRSSLHSIIVAKTFFDLHASPTLQFVIIDHLFLERQTFLITHKERQSPSVTSSLLGLLEAELATR